MIPKKVEGNIAFTEQKWKCENSQKTIVYSPVDSSWQNHLPLIMTQASA